MPGTQLLSTTLLTVVSAANDASAKTDVCRPINRVNANVAGDKRRVDEMPSFYVGVDVATKLLLDVHRAVVSAWRRLLSTRRYTASNLARQLSLSGSIAKNVSAQL